MGAHLQGRAAAGCGRVHRPVHRGLQRHGGLRVQRGARGVAALRERHALDVEPVLVSVKAVFAQQAQRLNCGRAGPLHLVHLERHADVQR